jgi:putative FmdB family regulatory protein
MPTYPHSCPSCGNAWDVVCRVDSRDDDAPCPQCETKGVRLLTVPNIDKSAAGDWNTPHFNPALGQVVNSNKQAQKIAKAKGMIEVGNEKVENIHKHFEKQREAAHKERWENVDRVMKYE